MLVETVLELWASSRAPVVCAEAYSDGRGCRSVIDPTQGYKPFVFNSGQWEERLPLVAAAEEVRA